MKFNLNIEDIKYIKILYADANGNPVSAKAGLKKITEREITACLKFEDYFHIEIPQVITISFVCPDGLYRTKTKLKSYLSEAPYIILYMETPENLEFRQNREYFRVPASYQCKYYVNNNGTPAVFDATVADISANGISIIMPVHIFPEDNAEIEVLTDGKTVKTGVRYIRSERFNDGYKLSFTYTEISNKDRDYIAQLCIKKQLEYKRNNAV